jgi:hypothetical protein
MVDPEDAFMPQAEGGLTVPKEGKSRDYVFSFKNETPLRRVCLFLLINLAVIRITVLLPSLGFVII